MSPRTLITQTTDQVTQTVSISGQIDARRDMGKIVFLDLRDRTGLLQVVCVPGVPVQNNPSPFLKGGVGGGSRPPHGVSTNFSPSTAVEGEREGEVGMVPP
ncbi:MAG: OB-fold nucleic acid binding domain-containing protein, partial [bacterium]|nr:OB-fold nucleic acid binding domain-containing protein [bacterium]